MKLTAFLIAGALSFSLASCKKLTMPGIKGGKTTQTSVSQVSLNNSDGSGLEPFSSEGFVEGFMEIKKPILASPDMLPGGLIGGNPIEKAIELYGEAKITGPLGRDYSFYKENKQLILGTGIEGINYIQLSQDILPNYFLEAQEGIKEYSSEATMESFISLGAYKLYLDKVKFGEVWEALKLKNGYEATPSFAKDQEDMILAPGAEESDLAHVSGYGRTKLTFRLYNPGDRAVPAKEALVIGVKVSDEIAYLAEGKLRLPVSAPYGVMFGQPYSEEFDKVPDKSIAEKAFPEEGGGYLTVQSNGINFQILALPVEGWTDEVNEILFTMMR